MLKTSKINYPNYKNKKILIFGFGKSGRAAALLAKKNGANIFIYDDNFKKYGEYTLWNPDKNVSMPLFDLCILSPGISLDNPVLQSIKNKKIPIVSEIEFAYSFIKNMPIIGITGTNGKTTTTSLINFVLNNAGIKSIACGNIGFPLSEAAFGEVISNQLSVIRKGNSREEERDCVFVVELSSFQLETIEDFKPDISIILNVTPDHMDRYNNLDEYFNAKKNIFINHGKKEFLILNKEDKNLSKIKHETNIIYFSTKQKIDKGAFLDTDGNIYFDNNFFINIKEIILKGNHNYENVMSAICALKYYGLSDEKIKSGLKKNTPVEHRMELVKTINEVQFINDSKATNIDSLACALSSYENNKVILIAGGRDKNSDFDQIKTLLKQKVKYVFAIGEAKTKIIKSWKDIVKIQDCGTIKEALSKANNIAEASDIILLSPACASFDMYNNYEERGNDFKNIVKKHLL